MDVLVEDELIIELKTVEDLMPVHEAQLLTYLKLSGMKTGLLLNFNVPVLKNGIKRMKLRICFSLCLCGSVVYNHAFNDRQL